MYVDHFFGVIKNVENVWTLVEKSMLQSSNSQICKGLFRQCYIFCCLTRPAGEIIFWGKLLFFKGCQLSTYLRTTNAKWGLHTTYSWNIKQQKCAGMGLNGFIFKKINGNGSIKTKQKSWEPFRSHLLNSKPNSAQFGWKWAGLAVLLPNGSHDIFF